MGQRELLFNFSEGEASDYRNPFVLTCASHLRLALSPPTPWAQPCFARRSVAQTPQLVSLRRTRASHRAPAASVRGLRLRPSARSCSAVLRRRPSSEVRLGAFVSGARAAVGFSTGRGGSCAPLPKNATRFFDNGRNAAHALAPPPLFPDSLAHSAQKYDLFQRGKAFSRAHDTRSRRQPLPETLAARTSGCARCAAPSILAVAPLPARLMHCGRSRISCWKVLLARVCRRLFRAHSKPLVPTFSTPPQHCRRGSSLCDNLIPSLPSTYRFPLCWATCNRNVGAAAPLFGQNFFLTCSFFAAVLRCSVLVQTDMGGTAAHLIPYFACWWQR